MNKIKTYFFTSLILILLIIPLFSFSAGLVPCDNSEANPCDFTQLMILVKTVINFVFLNLVIPLAAIMFLYAGFLMVTSGGSTEAVSKAKGIFTNAVWGLLLAAGSWVIVHTVLEILGYEGASWIGF